jgi:hypothetical protein
MRALSPKSVARGLLLAAVSFVARPMAAAESAPPGILSVPRASGAIKVDGVLDDPGWTSALRMDLPYEFRPAENVAAPVRTECWVTYGERDLYVAFRAHDPEPSRIRAHLSDRDSFFRDDFVGIILDTFGDDRRAFEFLVNPLGVQADGVMNDLGNGEDYSWDAIWNAAGRITPDGYDVEISIPFTSLRFPRSEGDRSWGLQPTRSYPRTVRHQISLTPIDRNRNCFLCQSTRLVGFEGITPGRNIELDPTLTSHRTDARADFPSGAMETGEVETEPGLSARWGFTPGLGLNAALNPDFSQVEADAQQLAVNTRFALYYPEKRPLFLEGADYFETPYPAVYTRTIADPSWVGKVSGKQGRNALGAIVGHDTVTNLIFPANQGSAYGSLGAGSDAAIARYRVDIGKSSALGALVTDREGDGYHNRLAGADGLLRLNATEKIMFQALHSSTAYPDALVLAEKQSGVDLPPGDFDGSLLACSYQHESREWNGWASYNDLGRGFRADLGFIPRVDTRESEAGYEKLWWGKPGATINEVKLGGFVSRIEDHEGRLTDQAVEATLYAQGPYQSSLDAEASRGKELFDGTLFDKWDGGFFFNIRPTGDFTCSLGGEFGDQVDYESPPGSPRLGRVFHVEPGLTYDRGHVRLQLDHTYETLTIPEGRLYSVNLVRLRLAYHLNLRTFVRAILQYQALRRDPALYPSSTDGVNPFPPESRSLLSQLLFSYKVNPQTLFFLGYSEGRLGGTGLAPTQTDRTLFLKLGYAWVL